MKIAFCCIGRTANNKKVSSYGMDFVVSYLRNKGHEVDVYGMTWDTCKKFAYNDFKDYATISESVYEDWLSLDLDNRISMYSTYNVNNSESFSVDNDKHKLESAKAAHAQLYMFGKILRRVLSVSTRYDVVIKWRWDMLISDRRSFGELNKKNVSSQNIIMNILNDVLEDFWNEERHYGYNVLAGTGILRVNDGSAGMIFDERMMAFTYDAIKTLFKKYRNTEELLDDINKGTTSTNRGVDSHAGWLNFSRRLSSRILCSIPKNIFLIDKN